MAAHPAPLFLVDAFASSPFTGNPAAVCLLHHWLEDSWLQGVAAEMNQSETAFLVPRSTGFHLRWFTPAVEVDLCGHATLAAACVLWDQGLASVERSIEFATRSGTLRAARCGELIELDFPLEPQEACEAPPGLIEALQIVPLYIGKSRFDYLVEVETEEMLRAVAPNLATLARVDCRGTIVTCRSSSSQFDFLSRFFAPRCGISEDPVTGSAHCTLAHYWQTKLNQQQFAAYQASRRGGTIQVRISGNRVFLAGKARITLRGELSTDPA